MSRSRPVGYPGKRSADVALASLGLLLGAIPLAVLYLLVLAFHGRPALFRQKRAGVNGEPFELIKFRSMTGARGPDGELLPDAERMTRFGKLLRSTSLDELPELVNVVKGEMSLVGPRPLLLQYNDRYNERQRTRLLPRPGLTGWAQVNGRNAVSWEERFEQDAWYVENCSPGLDLKILWLTIATVFKRSGVAAEGHATMPEFMGSDRSEA